MDAMDIADELYDQSLRMEIKYRHALRDLRIKANAIEDSYIAGDLKWKTKDHSEILIQDMTDEHVVNTLSFLKKIDSNNPVFNMWVTCFESEVSKRKL